MQTRMVSAALLLIMVSTLLLTAGVARADDADAWQALQDGEAVLLLRHALAPGNGDPAHFELDDCSTQRNLSDTGREQARAWRPFLEQRGISSARVFSSQWCRCMETARGMSLGPVTEWPSLNSFFGDRSASGGQTRQTRARVNDLSPGAPVILVSHQVNITALAGIYPASNEGVILALPLTSEPVILARVMPQ